MYRSVYSPRGPENLNRGFGDSSSRSGPRGRKGRRERDGRGGWAVQVRDTVLHPCPRRIDGREERDGSPVLSSLSKGRRMGVVPPPFRPPRFLPPYPFICPPSLPIRGSISAQSNSHPLPLSPVVVSPSSSPPLYAIDPLPAAPQGFRGRWGEGRNSISNSTLSLIKENNSVNAPLPSRVYHRSTTCCLLPSPPPIPTQLSH